MSSPTAPLARSEHPITDHARLDQRRTCVEHPFGTIKQWMNPGAFLLRRLGCVGGEFSLTALGYNVRRAITLVGVPGLIAATRA